MRLGARMVLGLALAAGPLAYETVADRSPAPSGGPPAEIVEQIAELSAAKAARSAGERKLSSQLLPAPGAAAAPNVLGGPTTLVDVTATVDEAVLERIGALGGRVVAAYPAAETVRVELPTEALGALAEHSGVRRIIPAEEPIVHGAGAVATEGELTHAIAAALTAFGVNGVGVKVGVISDGVDGLATSVAAGELPANVTVLPGLAGSGAEGRAMLEIVHDLAPGAQLYFATAIGGQAAFAQAILSLQAAGCTVIVDDIQYAGEPAFQDGIIAAAVNTVVAAGVTYLSSAGNSGNVDSGLAATWEGDFVDGGQFGAIPTERYHAFAAGAGGIINHLSGAAGRTLVLHWADPYGASANDYDLYAFDSTGTTVVAFSNDEQNGNDFPVEGFIVPANADHVVVVRAAGDARYLRIHMSGGRFLDFTTPGATYGHNAGASTLSIAATPAALGVGGGPNGPHPNPFTAANVVERFSSDGPRRIFFNPDGTPITPGNFTATGGTVLAKPDIAAADGVATSVPGFTRFFGTSAASPHAAAIVALMRSLRPNATGPEIATALRAGTLDVAPAGVDRNAGAGIVMGPQALQAIADAVPPPPPPPPADFVPVVPARVLETRAAAGQIGYSGPRPAAGQTLELVVVSGPAGVPADAIAVALNLTATEATAPGFVTAWPCGEARPTASNLNLATGDTRPNLVISKVGAGGRVCIFTQVATELLADIAGYMPASSKYVPVVPERLLDTRPAAGPIGYGGAKPAAGQTVELQVAGVGATRVPADATAAVLNITATEATVAGFVTVWPCGEPRPTASNLNLSPNVTAPNLVIAKLGAGGRVCLFTQAGGHLLADVAGYQPAGSNYVALTPLRVLDTRVGIGAPPVAPTAGQIVTLQVGGVSGAPAASGTVVLNVTATDVRSAGFVTVWPCSSARPTASNLNVPAGDTRPNLVLAKVGDQGTVCLYAHQPMALVADLAGYYPG